MTTLLENFETDKLFVTRNTSHRSISDITGKQIDGQYMLFEMEMTVREESFQSKNLQKGTINDQHLILYTNDPLYTDRDKGLVSDCINYNGCSYVVTKVIDNTKTRLPHYKSLAIKKEG